jgi:hypothetical protein
MVTKVNDHVIPDPAKPDSGVAFTTCPWSGRGAPLDDKTPPPASQTISGTVLPLSGGVK